MRRNLITRTAIGRVSLALVIPLLALLAGTEAHEKTRPGKSATVSSGEIDRHIRFLASDELQGRMTATPGAQKAAAYIEDQFRRSGILSSGTSGFSQAFPFVASLKSGPGTLIEAAGAQGRIAFAAGDDYAPLGLSADGAATGEVVFAGYGISASSLGYDDYQGVDVKDKIVLVLRTGPDGDDPHSKYAEHHALRRKALAAREHGAKAILIVADSEPFTDTSLATIRYDYGGGDSGILAAAISRARATALCSAGGVTLPEWEQAMSAAKKPASRLLQGVRATVKVQLLKETRTATNVIGLLKGSDPKLRDEVVIIGAHYDHLGLGGENSLSPKAYGLVHNGADDNASGTAALIEIARVLASESPGPKRSILFIAFSGEEEGVLGSNFYVKNPVRPLSETVTMINMDMIGRLKENRLFVHGIGTSPGWKALIEDLNTSSQFELKLVEDGRGPSDHASFYDKDMPVLFFFTGAHEDYHKPSDDADKINLEGEVRIAEMVRQSAIRIANLAERPVFTKVKSTSTQQAASFRVSLGSIPDYSEQVEGVKLSGVREGSPAEKGGMRGGDIIVQLGKREIKNVYDYTYALSDLKAGIETEVIVLRDGKRIVLKVVPERRQ